MNDFSELENELKKLRPAPPSPVLFERVEQALSSCRASVSDAAPTAKWGRRLTQTPYKIGFALAAAAVLLLLAWSNTNQTPHEEGKVAQVSPGSETAPVVSSAEASMSSSRFVSAGGTNVVYNARDEGLHFTDGSERPVRRVRYQTQQSWRWRNPETGASLRVSYPTEEIVLIPVSGQ